MKVIDLLVKRANGEKTPPIFKIGNWKYDSINGNEKLDYELFNRLLNEDIELNDEVEVIIEDKARFQYSEIPPWFDIKGLITVVNNNFERHQQALNEIIDKVNGNIK